MNVRCFGWLAALGGLALVPSLAAAVPVITGASPFKTSANTGATLRVFCTDCGTATDSVFFPPTIRGTAPVGFSPNAWVDVRVPGTWSGPIRLQKQGVGPLSNAWDHEISFSWSDTRWFTSSFTWFLNSAAAPGVSFNTTRDALVSGYNTWACASGIAPVFGGSTPVATTANDGINCAYWANTGWTSSTIAVTNWWSVVATGQILDADIAFNSQHFTWSASGAAGSMDIGHIGTHEQGHTLGLLDIYGAADADKTMYGWAATGITSSRSLHYDDALGAEFMYPHTRPNLRADGTPAGWYAGVTPRNTADATLSSAPLPAQLTSVPSYINLAMWNDGGDCLAPGGSNDLLLDDVLAAGFWWTGIWGIGEVSGDWRNSPLSVKGGRHTLAHVLDIGHEAFESNEADNRRDFQYVWSPPSIADQVVVLDTPPPATGTGLYDNCNGYRATGNWWGCMAALPRSISDDYDVVLYDDYAGALTGFQTPLESSFSGAGQSDFVLWNGNELGQNAVRFAGIVRFNAPIGANVNLHHSNEVGSTLVPSTTYGSQVSSPVTTMGAEQVAKVHEVFLGSTDTRYQITLDNQGGSADLNIGLYPAGTATFRKSDYVAAGILVGAGTDESLSYQPAVAGYYAVVVWKRNANDIGDVNTYQLRVGPALSNLTAQYVGTGDTAPNVPRSTEYTGGALTVSPTLPGETGCHLYYMNRFEGPNPIAAYDVDMLVDDALVWTGTHPPAPSPLITIWHLTPAFATIPGGRHTLSQSVDDPDAIAESDETDNVSANQYVWNPAAVLDGVPLALAQPPLPGSGIHPNANGRRYSRTPTYAWVSGIAAEQPLDDYDLLVYDDYTSSTSGFSNLRRSSSFASNATDFVVGAFNSSPDVLYPAVVREAIGGGGLGYRLDHNNDFGRFASGALNIWRHQDLAAGRLVDVYSVNLAAGTRTDFGLWRESGTDDIAFALFPPTAGGVFSRSEAIGASVAWGGSRDTLEFVPSTTGWHPLVVYRTDGTQAGTALAYTLGWGNTQLVGAPDPGAPASLSFSGPYPNPARAGSRLVFALPEAAEVSLALFDIGGRRVATLASGHFESGRHEVSFSSQRLAAGLYWARLEAGGRLLTRRVTVIDGF